MLTALPGENAAAQVLQGESAAARALPLVSIVQTKEVIHYNIQQFPHSFDISCATMNADVILTNTKIFQILPDACRVIG